MYMYFLTGLKKNNAVAAEQEIYPPTHTHQLKQSLHPLHKKPK